MHIGQLSSLPFDADVLTRIDVHRPCYGISVSSSQRSNFIRNHNKMCIHIINTYADFIRNNKMYIDDINMYVFSGDCPTIS
jgi:hypothetical protein